MSIDAKTFTRYLVALIVALISVWVARLIVDFANSTTTLFESLGVRLIVALLALLLGGYVLAKEWGKAKSRSLIVFVVVNVFCFFFMGMGLALLLTQQ
jgi:hypothetical protein